MPSLLSPSLFIDILAPEPSIVAPELTVKDAASLFASSLQLWPVLATITWSSASGTTPPLQLAALP